MRKIENYKVFILSHKLVIEVYKISEKFPRSEIFGLINQIRRAAYSIPMNLVEGGNREPSKEFANFINISLGSCGEVIYQLMLAKDLGYITNDEYIELKKSYVEVKRMLTQLYKKVKNDN